MLPLTKIDISSTKKVDIGKSYFCFFICVTIKLDIKVDIKEYFLYILTTDLCSCLISMCNFLTCFVCELT